MKPGEIIRIAMFFLLGLLLMMWLQPLLYRQRVFGVLRSMPLNEWIGKYYVAAWIVFGVSVLFTVGWYFLLLYNQGAPSRTLKLIWYLGLFLLVVAVSLVVYFNNRDAAGNLIQETVVSLMGLLFLDSVIVLYWLPTVTSTPGLLKKKTVPMAKIVNHLMGRN
ncbi:MAG: hypothetical protein NZ901_03410 [Geminocystis sp.]|nr:hypothetical protein [Geminocystis sp.]HIK36763.1 hypothetical protein [Geminocystis sp. M7585_C2015_104]MCS7147220.1 hypothetical protein [Geminocystis sp.]MCX8078555.1 hypothetical protein [Geminocystis sp.]MDW8116216.1 hypothetical protein [Geminocystis sp.]